MGINIHEVQQKNSSKLEFRTVLLIFDNVFAVRTEDEPFFYSSRTQYLSKLLILSPTNNPTCAIL